ncbi:MAG: NFACT family protein, partial [Pseudobutyrivibrio sp.]|nr:NFACT family protein [Pseudobutyrivibrio sp.]
MALDGISIHALVHEFNESLLNGKINKISQPEREELLITINTPNGNKRVLISANASLPFMYITEDNKPSPATAPGFCMLLRKHIGAGRIIEISQMGLERAIRFKIQHLNEMGDITFKYLYIEIMGKHSNIIFCNEDNTILDSIKHIPSSVSSVREVLPGRDYFIPVQEGKVNPLEISEDFFKSTVLKRSESIFKAIMSSFIGISPTIANEICYRANIDSDASCASLFDEHKDRLYKAFSEVIESLNKNDYFYNIVVDSATDKPIEYAPIRLTMYQDYDVKEYDSMSKVLVEFYAKRNAYTNIRQKSSDLRKIISNHIERASK